MPTDLSELIETEAAEPQSSSGDAGSATGRSLESLIAADRYLASKTAARRPRRGIRFTKLIPPAAISDNGDSVGGR